eukprot:Sspe_Gene.7882::Locus_2677_Transcript_1_1_Confidence_1.000_Length_2861::g.7882::m.7882
MSSTLAILAVLVPALAVTVDFEAAGGVPGDKSLETAWKNGRLLNDTLGNLTGVEGSVLRIPQDKEFYIMGGIRAAGLVNFTLDLQGKLTLSDDLKQWPRLSNKRVLAAFHFDNCRGLVLSGAFSAVEERSRSSDFLNPSVTPPPYKWDASAGVIDGQGKAWWGIPLIGYAERQENRPRLVEINNSTDVLVSGLYLRNSGYWTFLATHSQRVEVRYSLITAMREDSEWMKRHSGIALTAFNTDGFDFSDTSDVYVHDVEVYNQDDSICIKDNTKNFLIERASVSGSGLVIGSIGNGYSKNVTFRNCVLRETDRAIYAKFRADGGNNSLIEDVTWENIGVRGVPMFPIWVGPAQQADSVKVCSPHPCSLCWPEVPGAVCSDSYVGRYNRITIRNVTITDHNGSPGVVLGGKDGIDNLTMENVQVDCKAEKIGPWYLKAEYYCKHINNLVYRNSSPPLKC